MAEGSTGHGAGLTPRPAPRRRSRGPLRLQRLLLLPLLPGLMAWLLLRLLQGKDDRRRWRERWGQPSCPRPPGPLLWFHAASVGELRSLEALLRELRQRWPDAQRLVTTGSRSSAQLAQQLAEHWGFVHQMVPLNLPWAVAAFLQHWQPTVSVFVESEFWPELLAAAPRPVLVNGRVSDRSFRGYRRWPGWSRWILSHFHLCLAQSATDAERLQQLGCPPERLHTVGNLKADAPPLPVDSHQLARLRQQLTGRPVLLLASTHPGEEALLLQALQRLRAHWPQLLVLVAPRHPQRGPALQHQLQHQGWQVGLRSRGDEPADGSGVYVADTLGELGLWIRLSRLVVIGGSFVNRGGQNPLEAARLGVPVVCGPWMGNFRSLSRALQERGWLEALATAAALEPVAQRHLAGQAPSTPRQDLADLGGGSRTTALQLLHLLRQPTGTASSLTS